jgi:NAD(P)H-hydrate epimerase
MALKYLTAKSAAALDASLMSKLGYTLEQLMELAGLSVAESVYTSFEPVKNPNVLILCGPGNNGGDGLVAARHLKLFGYEDVKVYMPRVGKNPFYENLCTQLKLFDVEVIKGDNATRFNEMIGSSNIIVDALFGFSFHPPLRDPFDEIVLEMVKQQRENGKKIVAVDVPSGWDVDEGPVEGSVTENYMPDVLVSLTAPKPCSQKISDKVQHYLGGRFISKDIADEWGFDMAHYKGTDQHVRLS